MRKKFLIKGAIIVFIASMTTRVLGFIFRIFLADNLNAQGMGIFQLIMSLYMLIVTFATAGISFSVSRIISENMATENKKNPKIILKISIIWAFSLGLLICFLLLIFKEKIAVLILHEKTTTLSIFWLSFSIPFIAVSSCIKGYFYAKRKPILPSSAFVFEQVIKMLFVFVVFKTFNPQDLEISCAIVAVGMTISEICSCLIIFLIYIKSKKETKEINEANEAIFEKTNKISILKNILKVSVPIQISSSFNATLKLIESILIIESLKVFTKGDVKSATESYGIIKGMVLPLIMFPTSFLQSIITVLIPELSGATAKGNKIKVKKACEKSLQLTTLLGIFVSAIFVIFPFEIASIFYKNPEVAPILKKLSLLCPIIYVQLICIGILNSIGEQMASLKYNILEGILAVLLIAILVPKGGVNYYLISMFIVSSFSLILYAFRLFKVTYFPICISKILIKPVISIVCSYCIYSFVSPYFKTVFSNLIFIIISNILIFSIYFIFLLCFGCLKIPEYVVLKTKNKN